MYHSILYSRGYALESDDDSPNEEVDEEGFTTKEAEAFTKVLGRDHRTPLFEDLTILVLRMKPWLTAAKAYCLELGQLLTGTNMGRKLFCPGMAASQPNKATMKWVEDKDAVDEEQRLWERAAKKLREEDPAKVERKKEEAREAKWKDDMKMEIQHSNYLLQMKEGHKKMMDKRQKDFEANCAC
ncbi:hypothetical protein D1007_52942 [Hordeum vulgare]|nr:hypothetical protein D1007_52942 [Hordeum vulgare]